jgi:hypothetical protein
MPARRREGVIARGLLVLGLLLVLAGSARAGGTLRGYVLLPDEGRLAFVDVGRGRVLQTAAVPHGSGPIVASIDGSRVLVANTRRGVVTETNGITGRRVRTFAGLGHPIELALIPWIATGLVRPRYAIVLDARGFVDVLDLVRGRVVGRIRVVRPLRLALVGQDVWVASARSDRLTQVDVSEPASPRLVGRPSIGGVPVAIAGDPDGLSDLDAVLGDGRLVQVDAISLHVRTVTRIPGHVSELLSGYEGVVWAAQPDGHVLGVRTNDGHVVSRMHVLPRARLAIVAGWLAATNGDTLRMSVLGATRRGRTTTLPGRAGAFSYAVLP